jgi:hypothetical protein
MVVFSKTLEVYKTPRPRSFHTMIGTKAPLLSLPKNKRGWTRKDIRRRSKTMEVIDIPPFPHMTNEEH